VQNYFLFVKDDSLKTALFKNMVELVAITSPTMGGELFKEPVYQHASTERYRQSENHPPALAQSPLRGRASLAQAGKQPDLCSQYFRYPLVHH
jgi:hypothetical protein